MDDLGPSTNTRKTCRARTWPTTARTAAICTTSAAAATQMPTITTTTTTRWPRQRDNNRRPLPSRTNKTSSSCARTRACACWTCAATIRASTSAWSSRTCSTSRWTSSVRKDHPHNKTYLSIYLSICRCRVEGKEEETTRQDILI